MSRSTARKKPTAAPRQPEARKPLALQPAPPPSADERPRNAFALVNSISKAAREARTSVTAQWLPGGDEVVVIAIRAAPATTTDLSRGVAYAQAYAKRHGLELEPVVFMMCKR
jgi:hypothetical protein